jgi:hypothetical protein
MRPSVPSGRVVLSRGALRLSTAHDPVIESGAGFVRSPLARRTGPAGPKLSRRPRASEPREPSALRRVPERSVASALAQSPKGSIGPALAALRRAVAAKKCARLAARLAGLAGLDARR